MNVLRLYTTTWVNLINITEQKNQDTEKSHNDSIHIKLKTGKSKLFFSQDAKSGGKAKEKDCDYIEVDSIEV